MHFSRPSGHRLSWCRPWYRGAVGGLTSGYSTVSTLRNICRKVTANPLTGLRKSSTCDLFYLGIWRRLVGQRGQPGRHAVVVRQVHRRHGEAGILLGRFVLDGLAPLGGPLGGEVPRERQREEHENDRSAHQVDPRAAALTAPDPQ